MIKTFYQGLLILIVASITLSGCSESAEDAPAYLARAETLLADGKPELAAVELRNALRLDPTLLKALQLQWQLQEQQRAPADLLKTLNQIVALAPQHLEATLRRAEVLLLTQSPEDADADIERALTMAPNNLKALNLKTAWLLQTNATAQAAEHSQRALQHPDANVTSYVLAIMAHTVQQEFELARGLLNEGLAQYPEAALLLVLQTRLIFAQGRFTEVPDAYEVLLAIHPTAVRHWWELAQFYVRDEQYDEAISVMRRAVAVNPDDNRASYLLAELIANSQRSDSIDQIESLVAANGAVNVRFLLADLYRRNNQYSQAQRHLATIMAHDPEAPAAMNARVALAQIALNQSKDEEAVDHIRSVLQADEQHTGAQVLQALIEVRSGQGRNAIERLRRVLRDAPDNDQAFALLGRAYLLAGTPDLARDSFKSALSINPLNGGAALQLALMYRQDQEPGKIIEILQPFESSRVGNIEIERELLRARLSSGEWEAARRLVRQGAIADDNPTLRPLVDATILQARGRWDESVKPLKEILQQHPQSRDAGQALVRAYQQLNQPEKAINFLSNHRRSQPLLSWPTRMLFDVYAGNNRIDDALMVISEVIDGPFVTADHFGWKASLLIQNGNTDQAVATLESGIQRYSDSIGLYLDHGLLLDSIGKTEQAAKSYEQVLLRNPDTLIAANNLAVIYGRNTATISRARELAEKLRGADNPNFSATLGWLCLLSGELDCAIHQLEEAIERLPTSAEPHYHLGLAYRRANQDSRGVAMLRKAQELVVGGSSFFEEEELRVALERLNAS